MTSSLWNLVKYLPEGIDKIKCKARNDKKIYELCGIEYKDFDFCFDYTNVKNGLEEYKSLCCYETYKKIVLWYF